MLKFNRDSVWNYYLLLIQINNINNFLNNEMSKQCNTISYKNITPSIIFMLQILINLSHCFSFSSPFLLIFNSSSFWTLHIEKKIYAISTLILSLLVIIHLVTFKFPNYVFLFGYSHDIQLLLTPIVFILYKYII